MWDWLRSLLAFAALADLSVVVALPQNGDDPAARCETIALRYARALDQALSCDPRAKSRCDTLVPNALLCGCDVYVNSENVRALQELRRARARFAEAGCDGFSECPACTPPVAASCGTSGLCSPKLLRAQR
jgi:hypothetical protein